LYKGLFETGSSESKGRLIPAARALKIKIIVLKFWNYAFIPLLSPLHSFFSSFSIASYITEIFIESTSRGINSPASGMRSGNYTTFVFKRSINLSRTL
jgi:hypothetical protein